MIIPQTFEENKTQNEVVDFLIEFSSKENHIDSNQLSKHFEIPRIEVRNIINKARSKGVPICSSRFGYYFSTDEEEIEKTVRSLSGRVHAINNAINGMCSFLWEKTL